jgi:ankyrin repeat protein
MNSNLQGVQVQSLIRVLSPSGRGSRAWLKGACLSLALAWLNPAIDAIAQEKAGPPSDLQVLKAAHEGDATTLQQLLERGGNPRADANSSGPPAISQAIFSKSLPTVEVLLRADPSVANQSFQMGRDAKNKETPLTFAVRLNQASMIAPLVKAGARLDDRNGLQLLPVEAAVLGNDRDSVSALVAAGTDPKVKSINQGTLLHLAVTEDRPEMVSLLLGYGLDVNVRDCYGVTALDLAAASGSLASARALLNAGAKPYPLDAWGHPALHHAKTSKKTENVEAMVGLLLEHHAPKDEKNRPIDDALLSAARQGDLAAVKAALAGGADLEARHEQTLEIPPLTALFFAAGHPQIVTYLVDRGADLGAMNPYNFTPLNSAAGRGGSPKTIEILVAHGMDVNLKSKFGTTALSDAVNMNVPSSVEVLLRLGADPYAKGPGGIDLMTMAREEHHSTLLAPMLEKARAAADAKDR